MSKDSAIFVRISAEMDAELKAIAADRGESVSLVAREALREYLRRKGAPLQDSSKAVADAPKPAGVRESIKYPSLRKSPRRDPRAS